MGLTSNLQGDDQEKQETGHVGKNAFTVDIVSGKSLYMSECATPTLLNRNQFCAVP